MKITYILSDFRDCGPVKQFYYLCLGLKEIQNDLEIDIIILGKNIALKNMFDSIGVNVILLPNSIIKKIYYLKILIKSACSNGILHSYGLKADVVSSFFSDKSKTVVSLRCNPYVDYVSIFGNKLIGKTVAQAHLFLISKFKIIACSKSLFQDMSHHKGVSGWIQNSHPGVERSIIGEGYYIGKKLKVIVLGSLISRKNNSYILEALKKIDNIEVHFYGSGSEMHYLKSFAYNYKLNCKFFGFYPNAEQQLMHYDILLSASVSEGLPNSVIEALMRGRYVVLSGIGPHAELVEDDHSLGVLFDLKDNTSLVSLLNKLQGRFVDSKLISEKTYSRFSYIEASKSFNKLYSEVYNDV